MVVPPFATVQVCLFIVIYSATLRE